MECLREDSRQGEHLSGQVGEVSQNKDEAWLNDLDVFGASGQKRDQQTEHKAQEGTAKRHHEEWNCRESEKEDTRTKCYPTYVTLTLCNNLCVHTASLKPNPSRFHWNHISLIPLMISTASIWDPPSDTNASNTLKSTWENKDKKVNVLC